MPTLVKLAFTHYSPKDSEDGVKAFLIVDSEDRLIAHIGKECILSLDDYADDGETSVCVTNDWLKSHPNAVDRAKQAGLTVETEYGLTDIGGNKRNLILALQGDTAFDAEDCYYGVTHYDWSDQRQITGSEAEMLVSLGVAVRI